jgi:hypothetical protein
VIAGLKMKFNKNIKSCHFEINMTFYQTKKEFYFFLIALKISLNE